MWQVFDLAREGSQTAFDREVSNLQELAGPLGLPSSLPTLVEWSRDLTGRFAGIITTPVTEPIVAGVHRSLRFSKII